MTAKVDIEKLAVRIAQDANGEGVTLENRIEAMKVLNVFYGIQAKNKGKVEDDSPDEGPSFGRFRASVEQADQDSVNGRPTSVRNRQ